jgi:3-oxoacyl-[acyl-carrier protein] reductase
MSGAGAISHEARKRSVVIVTGAGQGIGRVFANAIAVDGAVPIIADVNVRRARAVAKGIRAQGLPALAIHVDVGNEDSVAAMVAEVMREFGRIDALVNNAAIFSTLRMRTFDLIPLDEWHDVMRVNVGGPFICAKAIVPIMRKQKRGRIVNVGSAAVTLGRANYLHYIASKGAVEAMTRAMARELGPDGIRVNTILPGATFTEIKRKTVTDEQKEKIIGSQCIRRAERPEDLVGALLFLLSDSSDFVTGQSLTVDGGATHR